MAYRSRTTRRSHDESARPVATVVVYWIPLGAGVVGCPHQRQAVRGGVGDPPRARTCRSTTPPSRSRSRKDASSSRWHPWPTLTASAAAPSEQGRSVPGGRGGCGSFATRSAAGATACFQTPPLLSVVPSSWPRTPRVARRLIELVPTVPTPTWGRDELSTGEMWNSNSVTSWLLARSGVEVGGLGPPDGGRGPGWDAGLAVAARSDRLSLSVLPPVPGRSVPSSCD